MEYSKTPFAAFHKDNFKALREIAKARSRNQEEGYHFLIKWWCKKWNRPPKDPLLKEYTLEEMLLEFYEDIYDNYPKAVLAMEETNSNFQLTGDPQLDELERRLAEGEDPDEVMRELGIGQSEKVELFDDNYDE